VRRNQSKGPLWFAMPSDEPPANGERPKPALTRCPICKQLYDEANLTLLLYHSTPGHAPFKPRE